MRIARHVGELSLFAGLVVAASIGPLVGEARAQQAGDIAGSWTGGGRVQMPSGAVERASCRASFRRQGGSSYAMSAVCATASARVAQTAVLTRSGGNSYSGEFFNSEYGVSGEINITVSGNRMNASLSGGGGSAQFSLSR